MRGSLVTGVEPVAPPREDDAVWIVTAGVADTVKQTHTFVAAAELLLARHPEWNAAVVGLGGERFVEDGSRVIATGRVAAKEYAQWMARATVLVQLRARSNGESSAAVADALANGLPIVATDLGATSELPDDVMVKVPRDVTPTALAEAIETLVQDEARRTALRTAALAFAGKNTMREEAKKILAAITKRG
jgi:glycosyltransferase involved in cell wall biosynthesis